MHTKKMPRKSQMTHPNLLSTSGAITRLLIEGVVQGITATSILVPWQSSAGASPEIAP